MSVSLSGVVEVSSRNKKIKANRRVHLREKELVRTRALKRRKKYGKARSEEE